MNILQSIRRLATIEKFVHALLFCFAGASVGTISEFLLANNHNQLTSYGLAVALGGGLVAVSILLAGTDMSDKQAFWGMLAGVVVVAVMSATLQVMAYAAHGQTWFTASILGIGFPMVECILALGVAMHDAAQKRRQVLGVRDGIRQRIGEAVGDSMRDIDTSKVRAHIEKRVDGIIRQQIDMVINQMGIAPTAQQTTPERTIGNDEPANSRQIADYAPESLPLANQERQRLAHERQRAIVDLVASFGPLTTAELVQRLKDDRGIVASERTIRGDCSQLEAAGELVKDGKRWAQPLAIATTLPVMETVHVNGKH